MSRMWPNYLLTHTHTHTRTHARTHARTHTHTRRTCQIVEGLCAGRHNKSRTFISVLQAVDSMQYKTLSKCPAACMKHTNAMKNGLLSELTDRNKWSGQHADKVRQP